jgi:hypothetical protein
MQNIHTIDNLSYAKPIATRHYYNPVYQRIVKKAFTKFLSSSEVEHILNDFKRSQWSEEAFYHNIERTDVPEHSVIKDEHYYKALSYMDKAFRPNELLKPVHYADLRLYPWRLSTNIGAPYNVSDKWIDHVKSKYNLGITTNAKLSKHNLYNEFFVNNRYLYHRIKDGHFTDDYGHDLKYWNTAFARLHLVNSDEPDKVRLVFGAPTLLLQTEMAFIWPIQISLLNRGSNSPMLWGFETITGGWNRLRTWFASTQPNLATYFTFDWSKFDLLARHTVIDDIHKIWRSWFTFKEGYYPTTFYPNTTPEPDRLENLWNWMTTAIKRTPLLLPDGRLVEFKHSGIFSGYLQTQLLDSCYNMVVVLTVLSRMGYNLESVVLKVQGDDSIGGLHNIIPEFYFPTFVSLFREYAKLYFGSELNDKKTELLSSLEGAEVLKYRNKGGLPYRPEDELLALLYHPERSQALPNLMARAIGIAYANCGVHHRVYLICEDIYNYLASLGYSPNPAGLPGVLQYDEFTYFGSYPDDQTQFSPLPKREPLPQDAGVNLTRFPTYFDTVKLMINDERTLLTDHHWLSSFFLETPH